MSQLSFEVDTKGICLLCLSSSIINSNVSTSKHNDAKLESETAFKMLLRYLKVDVAKLVRSSISTQPIINGDLFNENLSVSLCDNCSSVAVDFLELFQAFEGIRIQLDLCIRQVHEFMEKGGKDSERVREYQRRMNGGGNIKDLVNSSIAGNLRRETMEKARQRVNCSPPRISLKSLNQDKGTTRNPHPFPDPPPPINEDVSQPQPQPPPPPPAKPEDEDKKSVVGEGDSSLSSATIDIESSSNNTSLQSSEEPAINEQEPQTSSPLKCGYCQQSFFRQINLQTHQYSKHTMRLLSDKGLLPSNISERQLESALENLIGPMKSSIVKCPFCSKKQANYHLRGHLLHRHLHGLIESAKQLPTKFGKASNNRPETPWKCVPCKLYYADKNNLQTHKTAKHTMAALLERGLLPSHISEYHLETALVNFSKIFDAGNCPLCGGTGFRNKSLKRIHLVRVHLSSVIENAGKIPVVYTVSDEEDGPVPVEGEMKCSMCGISFLSKSNLEGHQLRKHMMTVLKKKIPANVSEEEVMAAIKRIASKTTIISRIGNVPVRECHFCSARVWTNQKVHLLKNHLVEVVQEVEEYRKNSTSIRNGCGNDGVPCVDLT